MAQSMMSRRRDARQVFGQLFKMEREQRGLTQAAVVERLDALESPPDAVGANTRRRAALPWFGKDASWVSRIESGDVAKLDRRTVVALCRVLDCSRRDRAALLLAAGLSPYPIPACESWEELLAWYRCAAALLPDAGHVTVAARERVMSTAAMSPL